MTMTRRQLIHATAALAAASLVPAGALAMTEDEAKKVVRETINSLLELARSKSDEASKAKQLLEIMDKRAAMPQIARFAAGVSWRSMSDAQHKRFIDAFGKYLSTIYARRFQEYSGDTSNDAFSIGKVTDAGRKGVVVNTRIKRADAPPVNVDWLVTDQPGHPVIADIIIEGVSMLITQRDEIGAMLEKRGGNIDKLIQDLAA